MLFCIDPNATVWDQSMFFLTFFTKKFAEIKHWMASHCVPMSIMGNSLISTGSVMVFLFTLTFLYFQRKSCQSFLMFWVIFGDGFSTYASYQILLSMTWFIKTFFPISDSCEFPHFCKSSRIFFLTFSQFFFPCLGCIVPVGIT